MKKALEAAGECCVTLMMGMGSAAVGAGTAAAAAGLEDPPQASIDATELRAPIEAFGTEGLAALSAEPPVA